MTFVFSENFSGDEIKDKKVNWMHEQEDLLRMRQEIRSNLEI